MLSFSVYEIKNIELLYDLKDWGTENILIFFLLKENERHEIWCFLIFKYMLGLGLGLNLQNLYKPDMAGKTLE